MVALLGIVLMTTVCISAVLGSLFQRSLRREAPDLHERIAEMARLILLRGYCRELAAYPCSRAWASWMFANDWVQVASAVVLAVVVLSR
jgi:L-cystine uptake protein TcyP (sodium:dicarboxylate symporter family)